MGSLMVPLDLTLNDLESSKSRSFRYCMVEERYVVNIFPSSILDYSGCHIV